MLNCRDDILTYTKQLVSIESIVNTAGESTIAHSLFQIISSLPYFLNNPGSVAIEKTNNDDQERYNVMAFVKGKKETVTVQLF